MKSYFKEPKPKRITFRAWTRQFHNISDELIKKYRYYDNPEWGIYLSPPATFMVYGARELKRLKFDNSLAALRLWGFIFNETERLFRAKQIGKKIIAVMGDLGIVPVVVYAFPDCIPFYPECCWWIPFFRESTDLLKTASELGAPESACFVRSALSAFYKKAYFPKPDLIIASTGASCDDYSCIMQRVARMGYDLLWVEIPYRKTPFTSFLTKKTSYKENEYVRTTEGLFYHKRVEEYLVAEYERIWQSLFKLTKVNNPNRLVETIKKINELRRMVKEIQEMNYESPIAPLPALELTAIEFGNLYGYGDIDEWFEVVKFYHNVVKERVAKGVGVLKKDAIPIAWVTPSADPYLLNLVEDLGCRVVATEYVINQAMVQIEDDREPMSALARAFINASLIGTTAERIKAINEKIAKGKIRGVLSTTMFGASHCSMETKLIEKKIKGVPVLTIDVPEPFGINAQIRNRLEAFVESIR